jgi:murein DD-endopeptidase MepM/ murein hydrolase activator NlpD
VFIRVLIVSLVVLTPIAPIAAQADASSVYIVQPGDTLFSIARRFSVPLAELARFNGLLNPNLIYVGQELKIPMFDRRAASTGTATPDASQMTYRVHVVQPGENLFRLSLKYGVTVQAIAAANSLGNTALIFVGQQLNMPGRADAGANTPIAHPKVPLPDPFLSFDVGPLPVVQGGLVVVKVRTREAVALQGLFIDWLIPFSQEGDVYFGVVGVSANPTSAPQPGLYPLTVTATDVDGAQVTVSASIQVTTGRYNSEYIDLPPDRQALLDPNLIAAEREKLDAVWTIFNPTRYWNGPFSLPVENYSKISSPFGTRRSYNGGPFSSYHEGTDFSATSGTPVYAPADGVVVLGETLFVRGNAILIDHGWGVYTGLYHLSSIDVSVGQAVKQGDFIGRVGGTGLSTGPHLHWDLRVRSLNVDPMQLTRQALP